LILANAGVPSDRPSSLGWNAAHVKNVPGRKTDVNDATWLADLMAHGMIKASFVPDEPTQQIVRERSSHIQRIQKTLEQANIKLDSVVTNILGLSGRRILDALIEGKSTPEAMATLAHRRGPRGQVFVCGVGGLGGGAQLQGEVRSAQAWQRFGAQGRGVIARQG
jgi:hypothetical protein